MAVTKLQHAGCGNVGSFGTRPLVVIIIGTFRQTGRPAPGEVRACCFCEPDVTVLYTGPKGNAPGGNDFRRILKLTLPKLSLIAASAALWRGSAPREAAHIVCPTNMIAADFLSI